MHFARPYGSLGDGLGAWVPRALGETPGPPSGMLWGIGGVDLQGKLGITQVVVIDNLWVHAQVSNHS